MSATVVLQARTNSSRLPAKVLLPVNGIPLVVLAAQRASNTGLKVVVATSKESSDDCLCDVLETWNIPFFRGSLDNTLKRFVDALEGLSDQQIVVRLTGDNVVPDGQFIGDMLEAFQRGACEYLTSGGGSSGLPYGVSVEVTKLGHLRQANEVTTSSHDREHVTPWIIRRFGRQVFHGYAARQMIHHRCTVDTFDDYQQILRLFKGVSDPVQVSLDNLLDKLKTLPGAPITVSEADKLVLGTAQLGMDYGVANTAGQPSEKLSETLVKTAIVNGVKWLDTARAYGDSEQILGRALKGGWHSRVGVITKLSTLEDCPAQVGVPVLNAFVDRSIYQSCHALGQSSLDVLMLHRASHMNEWDGAAWQRLLMHRDQGLVKHLGVSVQTPEELAQVLAVEDVEFIQMPFNILDHRWSKLIDQVQHVKAQRQLVIHVRSVLLQGLLPSDSAVLWRKANCDDSDTIRRWLKDCSERYADGNVCRLCLMYSVSQRWIDGVVVGVESQQQLEENLRLSCGVKFTEDQLRSIEHSRPIVSENTLNPARWQ